MQELDKNKWFGAIRDLYSQCFNEGLAYEDFYFTQIFPKFRCFGIIEGENLISMAFVADKTLVFNGAPVRCPLILAVCTNTAYRKRGYAYKLIEYIKNILKNEGVLCVYLSPINPDIYTSNGFIPFCFEEEFVVKYSGGDILLKEASQKDISLLLESYRRFCSVQNAYSLRTEGYYEILLESAAILKPIQLLYSVPRHCGLAPQSPTKDEIAGQARNDSKSVFLGYIYFDGFYWDICADINFLCQVKELDGVKISIPSKSKESKVSQMICIFDEFRLKKICPHIEDSLKNADNFNFDKYQ